MATAHDIINRALRSIGVLASGESASYEIANDALTSLNDVLSGLANESLLIYQNTVDTVTMDGAASYTFGEDGTPDIDSVRPVKIHSMFYRTTDSIDIPVDIVTLGEFDAITDKTETNDIPRWVYVETSYPNMTLHVWPKATEGALRINSSKPLTAFAGLTTAVALPPGYERMLRYALAVELMPEYGIANQQVYQMMMDSKADLKRTNSKPAVLRTSVPFGMRRESRIEEG
jgi:hypothetical protein